MSKIVISSGHGLYVRGASGYLDEVNEARRVVERVASIWRDGGVEVVTYHDDVSRTQSENLERIVAFHNAQTRELDVSVHFNADHTTSKPMGTECLYVTQYALAASVASAIAAACGLPNRGGKQRGNLYFLNYTEMPAILIETVFVDSSADAQAYTAHFDAICAAIADAIEPGEPDELPPIEPPEPPDLVPPAGVLFQARGRCSSFGGPDDDGVSASEGLAFLYSYDDAPHLFLPAQPSGTSGLARRLNPDLFYVACRWDYDTTPKGMLANPSKQALVRARGHEFWAWPADWGPHEDTGRVADLSPALMEALDLATDDEVEVIYPAS
jgi:N-acetylmuramoyl-L-alanine amidase